ncbi:MAG: DivIVA domain-containing protein [Anaerovoracaceae bacterium]
MITPLDIENKEFARGVRGYKEEEVDDFLDLVIIDYEKLLLENQKLKKKLDETNKQIISNQSSEESVLQTLEAAKNLMTDISASAERRAEVLVKNARLDAELIQREARESVVRLTEEGEKLRKRVERLKERYRELLENELERFDNISDDLFADLERDFLPASMSQKNAGTVAMQEVGEISKEDLTKTRII